MRDARAGKPRPDGSNSSQNVASLNTFVSLSSLVCLIRVNMKSPAFVILLGLLLLCAIAGAELFKSSTATSSIQAVTAQSAFEKSEAAYRANNIGVALLEQYKTKEAVDSFVRALQIKPDLTIAR